MLKQRWDSTIIRLLRRGEPALVHLRESFRLLVQKCRPTYTVVDVVVHPIICLRDNCLQLRRKQNNVIVLGEAVELLVKHSDDLRAFIVDDGERLLVNQQRNTESRRGRPTCLIDLTDCLGVEHWVRNASCFLLGCLEGPASMLKLNE